MCKSFYLCDPSNPYNLSIVFVVHHIIPTIADLMGIKPGSFHVINAISIDRSARWYGTNQPFPFLDFIQNECFYFFGLLGDYKVVMMVVGIQSMNLSIENEGLRSHDFSNGRRVKRKEVNQK